MRAGRLPVAPRPFRDETLSSWLGRVACRYGLDGKLIDFGKQEEVPIRKLMLEYLHLIDDVVDDLGSRDEINYIHEMLNMGSGADRQVKVFRETGDLKKVVDYIVEETRVGVFDAPPAHS